MIGWGVGAGGVAVTVVGHGGQARRTFPRLLLDELDERAERRLRVHERDRRAAAAGARRLVDDAVAVGLHRFERDRAVVDAVADVMEPLALGLEVLRDRASRGGSA